MLDYSYKVWRNTFIWIAVFIGFLFLVSLAQACETPQSTIDQLNKIGTEHDLDYEIYIYEGERAKNIREFIKTRAGENIYQFDTVIIAKTRNEPMGYVGVHNQGCLVHETPISAADYFEMKTIGDGV